MKIGDVKVGKEYGASDSPGRSYSSRDPRQVKVLEIVSVEERVYSGYTSAARTKNVRRVKVEFLDNTDLPSDSWSHDKIAKAVKGSTLVIEARQLVGEWKDLRGDILARAKAEQDRIALEESITSRLKSAGFKKFGWGEGVQVRVTSRLESKVEFQAEGVIKLLEKLGV